MIIPFNKNSPKKKLPEDGIFVVKVSFPLRDFKKLPQDLFQKVIDENADEDCYIGIFKIIPNP